MTECKGKRENVRRREVEIMAVHKVSKKRRGMTLDNRPFKILNTDRETVASLGSKLRTALADIESLKKRVRDLEIEDEEKD